MEPTAKRRIVVADDSSLYRHILKKVINAHPNLEVVAAVGDGQEAVEAVDQTRPDAVVLDVNMPRLNGFEALQQILRAQTLPVIMISAGAKTDAQLAVQAVTLGAVDLFVKPEVADDQPLSEVLQPLADLVNDACGHGKSARTETKPTPSRPQPAPRGVEVIVLGASTGGVAHIAKIVPQLTASSPPLVIAQHMPRGFTQTLAKQLAGKTSLEVLESTTNLPLAPGRIVICAANDRHSMLRRDSTKLVVDVCDGPKEHHQRPSVDALFRSTAQVCGASAVGILLTGMGKDGAIGLSVLKQAGATTVAESEETAVVFGMPRAAIELNAASYVLPLRDIGPFVAGIRTDALPREVPPPRP